MATRSRLVFRALCEAGQQETINLLEVLPYNATLLQIGIKLGAAPALAGVFTITKVSAIQPAYDVEIFAEDPMIGSITDYCVLCDTEFLFNDSVQATYANADDLDVGLELIFKEGE